MADAEHREFDTCHLEQFKLQFYQWAWKEGQPISRVHKLFDELIFQPAAKATGVSTFVSEGQWRSRYRHWRSEWGPKPRKGSASPCTPENLRNHRLWYENGRRMLEMFPCVVNEGRTRPGESLSQNVELLRELHISDYTADHLHADWTITHPNIDDPMSATHNNDAMYRLDDFTGNAFNELPFGLSPNLEGYDYRPSNPVDLMQFWDPEIFNHPGEQGYTSYPTPLPANNAAGDHRRVRQRNLRR
ncbi:MAG: hypothetical protein Q9214_006549 [Letrouitia sp. 1 TL-2023]